MSIQCRCGLRPSQLSVFGQKKAKKPKCWRFDLSVTLVKRTHTHTDKAIDTGTNLWIVYILKIKSADSTRSVNCFALRFWVFCNRITMLDFVVWCLPLSICICICICLYLLVCLFVSRLWSGSTCGCFDKRYNTKHNSIRC